MRTRKTDYGKGQPSTYFPFLALPAEIRKNIYRLLLRHDKPIGFTGRDVRLSPSILRACRQVLAEARIVLYSENIFSMLIFDKGCGSRAYFLKCDHFGLEAKLTFERWIQDMKRFEISVEAWDEDELWSVKTAVRDVCNVLSEIGELHYLHLKLISTGGPKDIVFPRVLESFTLLRKVRTLVLDGAPPVYGQYLTSKITGSSPLDHLPKMYEALQSYAGPFDCCEHLLQQACNAMEEDDVDLFKRVREEIITVVTERMTYTKDHLFDHDASS